MHLKLLFVDSFSTQLIALLAHFFPFDHVYSLSKISSDLCVLISIQTIAFVIYIDYLNVNGSAYINGCQVSLYYVLRKNYELKSISA